MGLNQLYLEQYTLIEVSLQQSHQTVCFFLQWTKVLSKSFYYDWYKLLSTGRGGAQKVNAENGNATEVLTVSKS